MKKLINLTLIAMACLAVACHKDATLTKLQPVAFTGPLTSSTTSVDVTAADTGSNVITFNWPAVVYPYKAHVTYTLQVDLPTDTIGAAPWGNAQSVTVGSDVLTQTFKGGAFSALAIKAGIAAGDTGKLVVRVQAYQDRNAYSKVVTLTVITYKSALVIPPPPAALTSFPVLYLPGFYQGWNPPTAGTVAAPTAGVYPNQGVYEGYIYVPTSTDPSAYHFKFTSAPDWNHINYGSGGKADSLTTDGLAGDLVLPAAGYYELSANTTTLAWTATPVSWSIFGDAALGWNAGDDVPLVYNPTTGLWSVTLPMKAAGSFKFRANDAWIIDFGLNTTTNRIEYADNPIFGSVTGLNNMTVPSDGTYTMILDLRNPNNYYYYAIKN